MSFMDIPPSLARWFLVGGVILALFGFGLWFVLPIRLAFPPFLITSILSVGYGVYGILTQRGSRPPS